LKKPSGKKAIADRAFDDQTIRALLESADEEEKVCVRLVKRRMKGAVLFLAYLRTKRGGNGAVPISLKVPTPFLFFPLGGSAPGLLGGIYRGYP
jgi:hypothetical protein